MKAKYIGQGIFCKVDGSTVTERFQEHLDEFYIPFCKAAIRAFFIYGFVPWRTRRISKGDEVPEVIPSGLFDWHTELGPLMSNKYPQRYGNLKPAKMRYTDDDSRMVIYRITPTSGGWKEEEANIYVFHDPGLDVSVNSILSATVPSPLAHVLTDYKNLRQAQIRRSHADAWNTTARIMCTFDPKLRVQDNPNQTLFDFADGSFLEPPAMGQSIFPQIEAQNVWQRESVIQRQWAAMPSTHMPEVHAFPRDHGVVPQQMLTPCEDLQWLLDKFRRDVTAVFGVPADMIMTKQGGMNHETVKKTMASGRIFSTNMHEICRHLQNLLTQVYHAIYSKGASVTFSLVPMPRLEIESIADFKVLFEIGALTPDMSLKLSRMLLGQEAGMSKKQKTGSHVELTEGGLKNSDSKDKAKDGKDNAKENKDKAKDGKDKDKAKSNDGAESKEKKRD